jgi:hypothetical protein
LPPFEFFIQSIGGWRIVAVILVATTIIIFAIVCFVAHYINKKNNSNLEKGSDNLKEAFLDHEPKDKKRILDDIKLAEIDLLYHVSRRYLVGTNSSYNPWTIPTNPPVKLENIINKQSYEKWTEISEVARWTNIEK